MTLLKAELRGCLPDLEQFLPFTTNINDFPIHYLPHLQENEIHLFIEIFTRITNIHLSNELIDHFVESYTKIKLRTFDIQLLLCFIFDHFKPTKVGAVGSTFVQVGLDDFRQTGNIPTIIRQFLNSEVEITLNLIENNSIYQNYLSRLPANHPLRNRSEALLRRCIRLILLCFLSTRNTLVYSSVRAIIFQVINDVSGIPKKWIIITLITLVRRGIITRNPNHFDLLEIPNSSLAPSIHNWIDTSIDILSIINTLYKFRKSFSECVSSSRLLNSLELKDIAKHINTVGLGTFELKTIFQSALINVTDILMWYRRMLDELIPVKPIIERESTRPIYKERINLVKSLFKIGQDGTHFIRSILKDEYPQVRSHAISALEALDHSGQWRSSLVYEVYVKAGPFPMGTDQGYFADEGPQHSVNLDAFYISRTPITFSDYKKGV